MKLLVVEVDDKDLQNLEENDILWDETRSMFVPARAALYSSDGLRTFRVHELCPAEDLGRAAIDAWRPPTNQSCNERFATVETVGEAILAAILAKIRRK